MPHRDLSQKQPHKDAQNALLHIAVHQPEQQRAGHNAEADAHRRKALHQKAPEQQLFCDRRKDAGIQQRKHRGLGRLEKVEAHLRERQSPVLPQKLHALISDACGVLQPDADADILKGFPRRKIRCLKQSPKRLTDPAAAHDGDERIHPGKNENMQRHIDAALQHGVHRPGLVTVEIGGDAAVHTQQQHEQQQPEQQLAAQIAEQYACACGVQLAAEIPALVALRKQGYLKAGQQNLRQKSAVIRPVRRIFQGIVKRVLRIDLRRSVPRCSLRACFVQVRSSFWNA